MTTLRVTFDQARRGASRRAFSLLELVTVMFIVGLIAVAGMARFGHATLNTTDTEGLVRRLVLDMRQARRAAIATGEDHYVRFNRTSGAVVDYDLYRDAASDYAVQPATAVPAGTTVTTAADTWRFDFAGALTTGGASSSLQVSGTKYVWTVTVYKATGAVRSSKAAQP